MEGVTDALQSTAEGTSFLNALQRGNLQNSQEYELHDAASAGNVAFFNTTVVAGLSELMSAYADAATSIKAFETSGALQADACAQLNAMIEATTIGGRPIIDNQYKTNDARLVFFDKNLSRYIPHMVRMYQNGKALHGQIWTTDSVYVPEPPLLLLTDWEDDGNGGVTPLPRTLIQIGMAPLNMSYYVNPSAERYRQLFCHEYTHVVMTDKYNRKDLGWRNFFGTKVSADNTQPLSALWSYFTVPRWYSPRWYHEGIACFMETWLGGGVGRALGGYDEMYFRSIIDGGEKLFSVVGLETELSANEQPLLPEEEEALSQDRKEEILGLIRRYVEDQQAYLDSHLTLGKLSQDCGCNRTYVSALLNERLGGFFNYVNRCRLAHAEDYKQKNPRADVDEVALESGFNSRQSYYNARKRL
ncbi:MAG: helix-turn-helix transcriptional regulator [Bacteroidales bacterium]|nr:helix-turn-helix transcriptional regulator [Bacteroidales bacterium]